MPVTLSIRHEASTVPKAAAVEATRERTGSGNTAAEAVASNHRD